MASLDILATVLRGDSALPILAKLKCKKGPGASSILDDCWRDQPAVMISGGVEPISSTLWMPSPSSNLLGLQAAPATVVTQTAPNAGNFLVDISSDGPAANPSLGPTPEEAFFGSVLRTLVHLSQKLMNF